ncbi:MAG: patatin-like phospholipase family protein [Gemmatimonadota bacterium]|nr:patatin-like phospholipase family protein [Gemmatimonadota bacterium]
MSRTTLPGFLLPFLLAITPAPAPGQSGDGRAGAPRPTVGIALSGGGARGLAHIGVLRALEEMRVPIDRIAGTSMGALVGGLYASGLSPDEIQAAIEQADWPRLLAEKPPRSSLGFRGRALDRSYSVETELGIAGEPGLRLPAGLSAGQDIVLLLRRLTLPVAPVEDFSELPIPFTAVATDLETAERVALGRGDLVEALRASMAFPLVFSPVEREGRLLVDGGIADNLPVDLARSPGVDAVVAVDVIPRLESGQELRGLTGILGQLTTILSRRGVARQLASADLAIVPPLEEFGLFDYRRAGSIVARGEAAVRARAEELRRWALSPAEYAAYRAARPRPPEVPDRIGRIRFRAPGWVDDRLLRARVELEPGDPIEPERLARAAEAVFAIGEFERVGYDVAAVDGRHAIVIHAHDEPAGGSTLRLGVELLTDSAGAGFRTGLVTFTASAAWIRSRIGARAAEWTTEARVGQRLGLRTEFHQPIDFAGRWFVEPSGGLERISQPVFGAGRLLAEYDVTRARAGLAAGRVIGRSIELRAGLFASRVDAALDPEPPSTPPDPAGEPRLPDLEERVVAAEASLVVDHLDDLNLPRGGVLLSVRLRSAREALGSERSWDRLAVEAKGFLGRGPRTGFLAFEAGSALGTDLPAHEEFLLGGLLSLSGFAEGELRGRYYGVGRAGGYRRIATVPADRGVYVGTWVEAGAAWTESREIDLEDLRWAWTAAAIAETPLGPAYLAFGVSEEGRDRIYVGLGRRL